MTRVMDPVMKELRETLLLMGSRSEAILEKSIRSLADRNAALASQVEHDDLEIDRLDVAVDDAVLRALALQAPVGADLREVVAIKMIATDLERVGDLARNVAKIAVRLARHPQTPIQAEMIALARASQKMLRGALNAFSETDPEGARAVLDEDDAIDAAHDHVIQGELDEIGRRPEVAPQAVDLIAVAMHLERVADHATNIAEDVILMAEARNVKHASKLA